MARAYPYRTPSVDEDDGMSCARISPRVEGLGVVPYGAIASSAKIAGVLKPKLAKAASRVSMTATGAKAGTAILPGIGTAIGAVVGFAASKLLGKKKVSTAEAAWKAYIPIAGQRRPGREFDPTEFDLVFEGMWKTNQGPLGSIRNRSMEDFKRWLVDAIAKGLLKGSITLEQTSEAITRGYVMPAIAAELGTPFPYWDVLTDLVDRVIANYPIGRDRVPDLQRWAQGVVPTLGEQIDKLAPPSSAGPTVAVPADAVPPNVTPPAIAAPAPLPAGATNTDVASAVKQIADALLATQQGQALSAQAQTDAVNAAALEWLKSQGVSTSSPAVKQTVAQASTASIASAGSNWLIPALAVGGMIAIASTKNGGRRRRRRK